MIHRHHYTPEEKAFIRENIKGSLTSELTVRFNEKFGTNLEARKIRAFIKNNGLSSGINSQFKSGHIPANKGTKGMYKGGEETQFPKGHRPYNHMQVGSERVNGDGYVDIKIAEPNKWRGKHLILWEQYHCQKVPKGHVVIFGDQDRHNFSSENLLLITRGQLAIMNKRGLIRDNAEFTKTGVVMAQIIEKISDRKRVGKEKDR